MNKQFDSGLYADGTRGLIAVDKIACDFADQALLFQGELPHFVKDYDVTDDTDELMADVLTELNRLTSGGVWDFIDGDFILCEGEDWDV
jgi:hypothetical protein